MERRQFLPMTACRQLFSTQTRNYRESICELTRLFSFAYSFASILKRTTLADYFFVNKSGAYVTALSDLIYLPRKGVPEGVLTYLKEAGEFFLNTNGSILFLSGLTGIPITSLRGLPQSDKCNRKKIAVKKLTVSAAKSYCI